MSENDLILNNLCHTSMYERDYSESEQIDESLLKQLLFRKYKLMSESCSWT